MRARRRARHILAEGLFAVMVAGGIFTILVMLALLVCPVSSSSTGLKSPPLHKTSTHRAGRCGEWVGVGALTEAQNHAFWG